MLAASWRCLCLRCVAFIFSCARANIDTAVIFEFSSNNIEKALLEYLSQLLGNDDANVRQFVEDVGKVQRGDSLPYPADGGGTPLPDSTVATGNKNDAAKKLAGGVNLAKHAAGGGASSRSTRKLPSASSAAVKKAPSNTSKITTKQPDQSPKKKVSSSQPSSQTTNKKPLSSFSPQPEKNQAETAAPKQDSEAAAAQKASTSKTQKKEPQQPPPKGKAAYECGCFGVKHSPLANCLFCGRVSCEKEGYSYCPFCGYLVQEVKPPDEMEYVCF